MKHQLLNEAGQSLFLTGLLPIVNDAKIACQKEIRCGLEV